jgi:uncharacterized membrane protein YcaP (DUF421 family)
MDTLIHAVTGYCLLLLTVRVLSRRPGGQLTLFDFVIIFLIGGIIIGATVGPDHSVTNCASAILVVGLMHRIVAWGRARSPRFNHIVDGTPLVLIKDGNWQRAVMRRMHIDDADVMSAARSHGIASIFDVKYAILERNGTISFVRQGDAS